MSAERLHWDEYFIGCFGKCGGHCTPTPFVKHMFFIDEIGLFFPTFSPSHKLVSITILLAPVCQTIFHMSTTVDFFGPADIQWQWNYQASMNHKIYPAAIKSLLIKWNIISS